MSVAVGPRTRSPLVVYGSALRRAGDGARVAVTAVDPDGPRRSYLPDEWCRELRDGDEGLLRRCAGPVLDVGCGPGRLTGALATRGHAALGIDLSAHAVRLARRRGAQALHCDVFGPVPDKGDWARVLLADGNIGIDGDPARLLRRCRELAAPHGRILVELDPPGTRTWAGEVRISADGGSLSDPFPWAYVSTDHLALLARATGLRILDRWTEASRWFASLS